MSPRVVVGNGMACPWPHGERIYGASIVGGAVERPGESGRGAVKTHMQLVGPHSTHLSQNRKFKNAM